MPLPLPHTRAIINCATTYTNNYNNVGIIIIIVTLYANTNMQEMLSSMVQDTTERAEHCQRVGFCHSRMYTDVQTLTQSLEGCVLDEAI